MASTLQPGLQITTVEKTVPKAPTATVNPYDKSPSQSGPPTPRSDRTANPFDTDVEAMVTNSSTDKCPRASIVINRRDDCQVWPGKDHWKQRAKAAKRQRSCTCMARLNRRTRVVVKILIVVLVVGLAVAIGFGVSKPLGAPIWGKSTP
ncbi:hypothetical protein CDD81_6833 [Ophiocordyceps australis]|uniref:Uncharacterized protein n=1 Tax=Ophiocordyceps australis TaxID=1399860 RepID=A0A2C5X988_9HYPO|nr:hypothetical protein CDD81_6833 [Ophiocordyceps australis]